MSMSTHHVLLCCGLFDNEEDNYWECKGPLCQSYLSSFALLESVSVAHVYTCMSGQWSATYKRRLTMLTAELLHNIHVVGNYTVLSLTWI